MTVVGQFRHGKGSKISANGATLNQSKFEGEESAEKADTSNFESGFRQGLVGQLGARFSAGGLWDAGSNPFDSPPGIFVQDYFPNLLLYTNFNDLVCFTFPLSLILSAKVASSVREAVSFDWSGESNGEYERPTGSAA